MSDVKRVCLMYDFLMSDLNAVNSFFETAYFSIDKSPAFQKKSDIPKSAIRN